MASSNAHRVGAEYSARLTAPDALDLKRADRGLVWGGFIEHESADSYRDILRCTLVRLERKAPLGDHITNLEDSRHASLCDR